MKNLRQNLIRIGHWEGVSFLLLLGIAMPLKYLADMPLAVRYIGLAHGVLFILFLVFLYEAYSKLKLKLTTVIVAFILSLLPFGTFFLNRFIPGENAGDLK